MHYRKPLRLQDIEILEQAYNACSGKVFRNPLFEAFKRAGAKVEVRDRLGVEGKKIDHDLWLVFALPNGKFTKQGTPLHELPVGRDFIDFATEHSTWRARLSEFAAELIEYNNITIYDYRSIEDVILEHANFS